MGKNALLMPEARGEQPGSFEQTERKGNSNFNKHLLQPWYAEEHLLMNSMSNSKWAIVAEEHMQ